MFDLLCLGEPLFELNAQPDGSFKSGFGGDISNVAIAAARQGVKSGIISRVGDDQFGKELCSLWARETVCAKHVAIVPGQDTGVYFVFHHNDEHHFRYRRKGSAASQMTARDLPNSAISKAKIFYSSGIGLGVSESLSEAVFHATAVARSADVTIAFDPNLRTALWSLDKARDVTHDLMRHCDIALPGLDDARKLTGLNSPDEIVTFYHELGAKIVALTLGSDGVVVSENGRVATIPGEDVVAKDATGAGDCFNGIFLANYMEHGNIIKAAEQANRGAALSTTGFGAVDPIPFKSSLT
ncbi:sugar kinase [Phaeobacter sp. C3_T13_0]|uniref:sugar kinase n=1 Tax=Phaeobacter cretensis TaxID=3342641 RepID=UPI0039BC734C